MRACRCERSYTWSAVFRLWEVRKIPVLVIELPAWMAAIHQDRDKKKGDWERTILRDHNVPHTHARKRLGLGLSRVRRHEVRSETQIRHLAISIRDHHLRSSETVEESDVWSKHRHISVPTNLLVS